METEGYVDGLVVTRHGDEVRSWWRISNFKVVGHHSGARAREEFLDLSGEGLAGIAVMTDAPTGLEVVGAKFGVAGREELVSASASDAEYCPFDSQGSFKTLVAATFELANDAVAPPETSSS
jgi:hypothetical protein